MCALPRLLLLAWLSLLVTGCSSHQPLDDKPLAPARQFTSRHYVCQRRTGGLAIDGRLDDPAWANVLWTEAFVDIEGETRPRPRYETKAKMLWDREYLYIAARLEEPHVWATLVHHDEIVFHDNDFEVFIDPDGDAREYYEIEINALNTIFDLLLMRTYIDGGPALHGWDLKGLRTAVHINGTLNDPSDIDVGWSVELALPWNSLAQYAHRPVPPRDGDTWRVNFSRVEWPHRIIDRRYDKVPDAREANWVWSPQGEINMHIPQRWGCVTFVVDPD